MAQSAEDAVIVGCSCEGLRDSFSVIGAPQPEGRGVFLADVVLPAHHSGQILCGIESESSRVSTGYTWPPDARLRKDSLRRIPVALAWDELVRAGSKPARWRTTVDQRPIQFPVSRLISQHILNAIKAQCADLRPDRTVIAIPDNLDEYGQECLLRDLRVAGAKKLILVWRPIAAALAWLDRVQNDLPRDLRPDDHILVVHLGSDGFEFVTLPLRRREGFVIPLRKRPLGWSGLSGYDWAACVASALVGDDDLSAAWQVLTVFPELWHAFIGDDTDRAEELPRPWSRDTGWELWSPRMPDLQGQIAGSQISSPSFLDDLISDRQRLREDRTWIDAIRARTEAALDKAEGRLMGVLLSGTLFAESAKVVGDALARTLSKDGIDPTPRRDPLARTVWAPGVDRNIVGEGAAVYGRRLIVGDPTYLDTLPLLEFLVTDRGKYRWHQLLQSTEVEGGSTYHPPPIKRAFKLARNAERLNVYLRKENREPCRRNVFTFESKPGQDVVFDCDVSITPASGEATVELLPDHRAGIGRRRIFMDFDRMTECKELPPLRIGFPDISTITALLPGQGRVRSTLGDVISKYLAAEFNIRRGPYASVLGKLHDQLRASTGFDASHGGMVGLSNADGDAADPDRRDIVAALARKLEIDIHHCLVNRRTHPGTPPEWSDIRRDTGSLRAAYDLLVSASYLFSSAPAVCKELLADSVRQQKYTSKASLLFAASRCLDSRDGCALMFETCCREIQQRRNKRNRRRRRKPSKTTTVAIFPHYWTQALTRILEFRESAPDALTGAQARLLAEECIESLLGQVEKENYKDKFFELAKFFIYILRYRISDPSFMDCDNEEYAALFETATDGLEGAAGYFRLTPGASKRSERITWLLAEIQRYMRYEGSSEVVSLMDSLIDSKGQ